MFQISVIETESKVVSDSELVLLNRAVRAASQNPLLNLIQTSVGPLLLQLQQYVSDALDNAVEAVNELKSSELYGLISIVLATLNISLDNVVQLIAELQANVNEIFAFFTGSNLASS